MNKHKISWWATETPETLGDVISRQTFIRDSWLEMLDFFGPDLFVDVTVLHTSSGPFVLDIIPTR